MAQNLYFGWNGNQHVDYNIVPDLLTINKTLNFYYIRTAWIQFVFQQDYVDADLNVPNEIEMQVDCEWERYQVLHILPHEKKLVELL